MAKPRTLIRFGVLAEVFRANSQDISHAHIARLSVLYEDLRIELFALSKPTIAILDVTDKRCRQNYFLRRSIGTLFEFSEALRLLDQCPSFSRIRQSFNKTHLSAFDGAVRYFRENENLIKNVRNDLGGHFGSEAAKYAVENISPTTVGKILVAFNPSGKVGNNLSFGAEIAATALGRHLPGTNLPEKLRYLFDDILMPGYQHAIDAMDVITINYLWPRFGK